MQTPGDIVRERQRLMTQVRQRIMEHTSTKELSSSTVSARTTRGIATGGISVYIPPESVYL